MHHSYEIINSMNNGSMATDSKKQTDTYGPLNVRNQYVNAIAGVSVEGGFDHSPTIIGAFADSEYPQKIEHDLPIFKQDSELHKQESAISAGSNINIKDNAMTDCEVKPQGSKYAPSVVFLDQQFPENNSVKQSHQLPSKPQLEYDNSRRRGSTAGNSGSVNALQHSKTLPNKSFLSVDDKNSEAISRQLTRSYTEKEEGGTNLECSEMRTIVAEKLSNRKKKKLMRKLGTIKKDGTVELDLDETARLVPALFGPKLVEPLDDLCEEECRDIKSVPPLQIVMLIVGTRGDVQPFIAMGKHLQEYGHRVRLATHENFREFVMSSGLEFFPLGGDPKVLAGYMVKNKGFLPSGPSEISVQRKQLKSIINSLLPACTEPDKEFGIPFRAQAMIANPPAYGHVHVHEALGVPLHIFFTMPWTPTSEFPHPLARIKNSAGFRMSYQVVDSIIWLGIRSLINDFRKKKLKLRPITYLSGTHESISSLPTGYIWSPHLVPKPKDWGPRIDVVGFCFLNLATDYKPPEDLVNWLRAGEKPIYIGFGSLPIEDPQQMMNVIITALKKTQQRGIVIKGWGLTGDVQDLPDSVYFLENCPHDWLFPHCAAVVHHGGAGTTAAGLKAACPTTIVPFFGDQPFWGERVHIRGVGPTPIPIEHLTTDKLVSAIEFMLDPQVKQKAIELAKSMEGEDGVIGAVNAFHKHLPDHMLECCSPIKSRRRQFYQKIRSMSSCSGR